MGNAPKVPAQPVEHDFTRLYWGRSFSIIKVTDGSRRKPTTVTGMMHATPGPKVGDTARWRTLGGYATARFTKVEPVGNPYDMYSFDAELIGQETEEVG
jgi:hypothetical protein